MDGAEGKSHLSLPTSTCLSSLLHLLRKQTGEGSWWRVEARGSLPPRDRNEHELSRNAEQGVEAACDRLSTFTKAQEEVIKAPAPKRSHIEPFSANPQATTVYAQPYEAS